MANRKNYTVTVPFPTGGGHWARKGSTVDLLDVEALALLQARRIILTADIEAAAVVAGATLFAPSPDGAVTEAQAPASKAAAAKAPTKKTTAKD